MFYDKHQENLKTLHDNLGTLEINTIAAIIDDYLSHQEKDSMIACFVFAVYAKHKAEDAINNPGIVKVIPLKDDKKFKKMLYEGVVSGAILTQAAILGIVCGKTFFEEALFLRDSNCTKEHTPEQ